MFLLSIHVSPDRFSCIFGQVEIQIFQLPVVEIHPPYTHAFCGMYGSPTPIFHAASEMIAIPVEALGDEFTPQVLRHVYIEHKVPWFSRIESAPSFTSE